jgi:hypothetical protein
MTNFRCWRLWPGQSVPFACAVVGDYPVSHRQRQVRKGVRHLLPPALDP